MYFCCWGSTSILKLVSCSLEKDKEMNCNFLCSDLTGSFNVLEVVAGEKAEP